jgi:integrase
MTTAPASNPSIDGRWLVHDDDPFLAPDRLPDTVHPEAVSRFGDLRWDLSPLDTNDHQVHDSLNWQLFPLPLRPSFRRAGWALVNLPTPDALLESRTARRRKWLHPASMRNVVGQWCQLARWLLAHDITRLCAVTVDDLAEYAVDVTRSKISATTATSRLAAVSLLWAFAAHLPPGDRIPMPPWQAESMRDYLPRTATANENGTPPIHPAVMSPLLTWAMRFVDDFADDILAAWQEHQTLSRRIRALANPAASATLRELVEQHAAENRPLPGRIHNGHPALATSYLAGRANASKEQVVYAVETYGSNLPVASETPLDSPVRGHLNGREWLPHITFHDAPRLMHRLSTACMIVILYLTGMRPGEKRAKVSTHQCFPNIAGCGTSTRGECRPAAGRSIRRTPQQKIQSSHRLAYVSGTCRQRPPTNPYPDVDLPPGTETYTGWESDSNGTRRIIWGAASQVDRPRSVSSRTQSSSTTARSTSTPKRLATDLASRSTRFATARFGNA